MDAQKFGTFVAENRKEKNMTQADLAAILKVTDKAISRWERGLGFPDINSIEPLADALGLSVLELMKSEKCDSTEIDNKEAVEIVTTTLDVAKEQRIQERKSYTRVLGITAILVILVLFLDSMKWDTETLVFEGMGVFLPLFCACAAIVTFFYALWRKLHGQRYGQTVAFGIFLILIPIILFCLFFLVGAMGLGPVPF